jgi:hypothetical protein
MGVASFIPVIYLQCKNRKNNNSASYVHRPKSFIGRANVCITLITDLYKKKYKVGKRKVTLHHKNIKLYTNSKKRNDEAGKHSNAA